MHKQITGDASSVVAIVSPSEEPRSVKCAFWRLSKEAIPVDSLRRSVGRNGVLPGAYGAAAVIPGFDHIQLADCSRREQFFGLLVHERADTLAADLKNPICLLSGLDHLFALFELLNHWLLTIHIFTGLHCVV